MKKAIKFVAAGVFAVALIANISLAKSNKVDSISLSGLFKVQEAHAECVTGHINSGRCSFSGRCFPGGTECDWTAGTWE